MSIIFDGPTRRIILDTVNVSAATIWSRWVDWHESNLQWPLSLKQVGGDDLGEGLSIPPYFFLLNSWRIRPMEQNQDLTLTGNMFVQGGGIPVVRTLGDFQVNVKYVVPVQAQGIVTSGGSGATIDYNLVGQAVRDALAVELARIDANVSSRHPSGTIIQSNVKQVNDVVLAGDGSDGNPWRAA
jgi:hypothetical protein